MTLYFRVRKSTHTMETLAKSNAHNLNQCNAYANANHVTLVVINLQNHTCLHVHKVQYSCQTSLNGTDFISCAKFPTRDDSAVVIISNVYQSECNIFCVFDFNKAFFHYTVLNPCSINVNNV